MQQFKYILILTFLPILALGQDFSVQLNGTKNDGKVQLLWSCKGWSKEIGGFNIKRKEVKSGGNWQKLHNQPIQPAITMNKDWSNQGLNASQTEETKKLLQQMLEANPVEYTASEFLDFLTEIGGFGAVDRLNMKSNFKQALILGFGFIDNTIEKKTDYEYAIFQVNRNGQEKNEPLAIYSTLNAQGQEIEITFNHIGQNIQLANISMETKEDAEKIS